MTTVSHTLASPGIPGGIASLADHEQRALAILPPDVASYFEGGAADEQTLRANRMAWQTISLRPRVLQRLEGSHTGIQLLGRSLEHPMLIAPMAHQQLAHPQGEMATALAASVLGTGMVLSVQASTDLNAVARLYLNESSRGPLWFQMYWLGDRNLMLELIQRVEAAGFEAIVLTVDAPVQGVRDRERRTGFKLPPGVRSVNLEALPGAKSSGGGIDELLLKAATWDDLTWLRSTTRLPVVLKGITHPEDVTMAIDTGAAAVVVSNHGGRVLDTLPSTAALLPQLVAAANGALPLLVDGGIRRGTDIFKAMALGASGVLIGRPVLHGLVNAGAAGVAHVIRLLVDELRATMALCGCHDLRDAHRHIDTNFY